MSRKHSLMGPRTYARIGVFVLVAAALVASTRMLPLGEWLQVFSRWMQELGPAGMFLYSLVYALAVVLLVPGSILTLVAGAAFGLVPGVASVLAGATMGAALAFLISRHVARRRVEGWMATKPRFSAVDEAVAREGWKIVLLTRLSPVFPFSFQNYAYGLTRISFWQYMVASLIGMTPGTFMYVYIGVLGRSSLGAAAGSEDVETLELALQIVGLAATLLVTIFIARIAGKALKEAGV